MAIKIGHVPVRCACRYIGAGWTLLWTESAARGRVIGAVHRLWWTRYIALISAFLFASYSSKLMVPCSYASFNAFILAAKLAIAGDVAPACAWGRIESWSGCGRRSRNLIAYLDTGYQRTDLIIGKCWSIATRAEVAAFEAFPPITPATGLSCRYESDAASRVRGYKSSDTSIRYSFHRRPIMCGGRGVIESLDVLAHLFIDVIVKSTAA
jgi:hypothetical protein